jgi:hypothetical protein
VSDEQKFTIVLRKSTNDKIKSIAEELGELLDTGKYKFSFFYQGEKVSLNERLGDKEIGGKPNSD